MVDVDSGVPYFFEEKWSGPDRQALKLARGRVLDVGAGAGRVALHLQKKGQEVVAIDNSPLAVRVLKARGVKKSYVMPFKELNAKLGRFDSIAMWGGTSDSSDVRLACARC